MEMENQNHFVLVHGACHGAWYWYKVATILKSAGHRVTALDLGASGINPKQVHQLKSISDYFEPLMELMECLPLDERVILVCHSFGGLGVSLAMEKFPSKISAAVFAAAMFPGPSLSYTITNEEYSRRIKIDPSVLDTKQTIHKGPNGPPFSRLFGPKIMSACLYQLSPAEDLMLALMLIRPYPLFNDDDIQKEMVLTEEKYGSVRKIYVVCDKDNIVNEGLQRWMIQNNPPDEVIVISDSDHMVMFSKPQEFCVCLEEIAKKYT